MSDDRFTEEALKSQDGKVVPLKAYPGGPVIGEAVMKYDEDEGALKANLRIKDPKMAELIANGADVLLIKKES